MALVLVLDSIIFLPLDQQRVEDLDAIGNVGSESVVGDQDPENVTHDMTCDAKVEAVQHVGHHKFNAESVARR